jgi:5-methylcytosine-specific restriction protein A
MDTRHFRTPESYDFERVTRDMLADYLRNRNFHDIRDDRKRHGTTESQTISAIAPQGERLVMRVRLCWRRSSRPPRENAYSAAQLLPKIKNHDWEGTLREKVERERSQGVTHFLFVQREDERIIYAALVPLSEILSIWCAQRDISTALIAQGQLGHRRKNHAMNGSSPTLWLQDEHAPGVAAALWEHPGVRDLAKLETDDGHRRQIAPENVYSEVLPANREYYEGAVRRIAVNAYERDPRARAECLRSHGTKCKVCDLSFEERYGSIGKDFIHVHHLKPLSTFRQASRLDPVKDLVPVCPNCHAMLHTSEPPLSVEELKEVLAKVAAATQ